MNPQATAAAQPHNSVKFKVMDRSHFHLDDPTWPVNKFFPSAHPRCPGIFLFWPSAPHYSARGGEGGGRASSPLGCSSFFWRKLGNFHRLNTKHVDNWALEKVRPPPRLLPPPAGTDRPLRASFDEGGRVVTFSSLSRKRGTRLSLFGFFFRQTPAAVSCVYPSAGLTERSKVLNRREGGGRSSRLANQLTKWLSVISFRLTNDRRNATR